MDDAKFVVSYVGVTDFVKYVFNHINTTWIRNVNA